MSIYVMTVGELAKKRGENVGDFVKKVQELGFWQDLILKN